MKHAVSQDLFDYWDKLRGARNAPERADLDPAAIRSILADTFVVEVTTRTGSPEREFPIRLSGTRLNALFMEELKGHSLVSLWRLDQRDTIQDMLDGVLDEQAATVAGVKATPFGSIGLDLELLLLPLRHHGHTHRRMLGSLAPFRVPSWLGLRPAPHLEMTSMRTVTSPSLSVYRLPSTFRGRKTAMGGQTAIGGNARKPVRHGPFTVHDGGR